jgi:hypothetical protein
MSQMLKLFLFMLVSAFSFFLSANPLAEWRMDEQSWSGSAGEVADNSGNNHNGTARNGLSTREGQVCRGGDFRGEGFNADPFNTYYPARYYVEVPGSSALSPYVPSVNSAMTISGWFNPARTGISGTIIHKGDGGNTQDYRLFLQNNRLNLQVYNINGGSQTRELNFAVSANTSYFFTATVQRLRPCFFIFCSQNVEIRLELFSVNSDTPLAFNEWTFQGFDVEGKITSGTLLLGATKFAANNITNYFDGLIDEIRIYSGVRTRAENLADKNATRLCTGALQCLADDFNAGLSPDNWVTSRSSGNFTPQVVGGRLRMTEAVGNQATSATYQRLYPAANNLVVVEFDYYAWSTQGGTGADGVAVILSDAGITPQPGAFGGSLGYAQKGAGTDCPNCPGFAGGWLGIALDEYGNFSTATEGRVGGPGFRPQSVSIRGSAAGNYQYLTGTGANLDPRIDVRGTPAAAPGHRYRITVDSRVAGQARVWVQRKTGSEFIDVIPEFNALAFAGQAPVPENFFLSFTGSTGGSNNNHELDNLSICALRSAPVGQQIDHFEFDYSGRALTCNPETFTVRACKNAACTELVTEAVTANLSPATIANGGWLGGNVINFSGGTTTVALRRSVAGSTTIGVSGSVPTTRPLSQTLCRAGSGALTTAACSISFADSGLVFDVPDGIANQQTQNIVLSAVRKDDNSQQCVPQFANVSRNVAFWSDYIDPGAGGRPVSWPVQINNTDVGRTEATRQSLSLDFNAQGQASFNLNYADAGQLQLNARYTGSAATQDNGLVMNGADQFKRRPAGLCIQTGGECAAADASCGVFRRAAENFDLTISAHAFAQDSTDICQNPVTPNFSLNNIAVTHQLLAPVNGTAGSLAVSQYQHQRAANAANIITQSVSEVGVFRFSTPALNYLGMADTIPAAGSAPTGRFIPQRFALNAGSAIAACGSFTYFGQQGFSTAFTLQALNAAGAVTQNYRDAFARLDVSVWRDDTATEGMRYSAPDLPPGSVLGEGAISPLGSWQNGVAQMTVSHYASRPPVPAAPLDLTVYARPTDADGVSTDISALNSDPTALRYGRLSMQNLAGPEDEPLPLVFAAEYWDGNDFLLNTLDSCTLISNSSALLTTISGSPELSLIGNSGLMQSGSLPGQTLWLSPTGAPGFWQLEYTAEPWLQYYWRGATPNYQQNPSAEVMFGRFRGNPRQISWRELFQ